MHVRRIMASAFMLATALLTALPATAQQLQGTPGAPGTLEFPDSRTLPVPTPPFTRGNLLTAKNAREDRGCAGRRRRRADAGHHRKERY